MVSELVTGIGLFKSMLDIAKGLKDINGAAIRNTAIIELQETIFTAREQHAALTERVSELKKEVTHLKAWDAEKEKYELIEVSTGAFTYMLKPDARGSEPPHWLCTTCYQDHKKSIIQGMGKKPGNRDEKIYRCPSCKAEFMTHWFVSPGKEMERKNNPVSK